MYNKVGGMSFSIIYMYNKAGAMQYIILMYDMAGICIT